MGIFETISESKESDLRSGMLSLPEAKLQKKDEQMNIRINALM
jgi:hypothetical protein